MRHVPDILVGFLAALCATFSATAGETPHFTITALDGLGGTPAYGINNRGQVAGINDGHVVVYSNGTFEDLGTLGAGLGTPLEALINNAGQILLSTMHSTRQGFTGERSCYLYDQGTFVSVGIPFSKLRVYAMGFNDAGHVVGMYSDNYGQMGFRGSFFSSDGVLSTVDTPAGNQLRLFGINNSDVLVGSAPNLTPEHPTDLRAVIYSGGNLSYIDVSPLMGDRLTSSTISSANAINDAGEVAGYFGNGGDWRPFLYDPLAPAEFQITDLGLLPGRICALPFGINNRGDVVGTTSDKNGSRVAFLFYNGAMFNLNDLTPADSGWQLVDARAINDHGQILCEGVNPHGESHNFLLTPTEPFPAPTPRPTPEPTPESDPQSTPPSVVFTNYPTATARERLTIRGVAKGHVSILSWDVATTSHKAYGRVVNSLPTRGITNWKFATRLKNGPNRITVTARERNGRSATASIVIVRKKAKP